MVPVEFTLAEIAEMCGVSKRFVQNWVEEGKFPNKHFLYDSPKMGYLIPAGDLLAFLSRSNPMKVPLVTKRAEAKEKELSAVGC